MIAVIFELTPRQPTDAGEGAPGVARYFELAGELKGLLEEQDGFISVERFESLTRPGRYLSLSFWRDEEAVRRWRCQSRHRAAQQEGRDGVLADYRLRVAHVMRDYGLVERGQAPDDSREALR